MIREISFEGPASLDELIKLAWEHDILYCVLIDDNSSSSLIHLLTARASIGAYVMLTRSRANELRSQIHGMSASIVLYCLVRGTILGGIDDFANVSYLVKRAEAWLAKRKAASAASK